MNVVNIKCLFVPLKHCLCGCVDLDAMCETYQWPVLGQYLFIVTLTMKHFNVETMKLFIFA